MASIYLIRHGQASFNSDNYDQLSPLGFQQARHLGEGLKQKALLPDIVISGTMQRHQETANSSIDAFSTESKFDLVSRTAIIPEITLIPEWNEFDHQNVIAAINPEWESSRRFRQHINEHPSPEEYFIQLFSQGINRWTSGDFDSDYKEPWSRFKERIQSGLEVVVNADPAGGNAFVFTSGGPISSIVMNLLNIPESNLLKLNQTLVNCGVTKLVSGKNGVFVSTLNEHTVFDSEQHQHMITYK